MPSPVNGSGEAILRFRESFAFAFKALTGHDPMPWQEALYETFLSGDFSRPLALPTGLGKTTVIHLWLLATANAPMLVPRRLVYVVNRRTIVDQATREAERLREILLDPITHASDPEHVPILQSLCTILSGLCAVPSNVPIAISTLRGQFADNGYWCADPARPAVVIGTVDMIGSRLLFSGYGRGFKSRPLHAGFLAQDSVIVHDEAHLEPAFQRLLDSIGQEQRKCKDFRPLQIAQLSATPRQGNRPFTLTEADYQHEIVQRRINARKALAFHTASSERNAVAAVIGELAISKYKDSGAAVLIYVRTIEDVTFVCKRLEDQNVQVLTGTLRGLERDLRARHDPIFARFLPEPKHGERRAAEPADGTVFLVCTSAGEVGIDISADHLICDLTPFDSMAQRFGRVNRYGLGDASIDVISELSADDDKLSEKGDDNAGKPYEKARARTRVLLRELPLSGDRYDASPRALNELRERTGLPWKVDEAFTPVPEIPSVSDILFDVWALTTIRERFPGRPPVGDWLHGVADWQPPETYVAWRTEVDVIAGPLLEASSPEDLLEDYPLKPHELLRDRTDRIFKQLQVLAERHGNKPAWIVGTDDVIAVTTLGEIAEGDKEQLSDRTVLLPPSAGGLRDGLLDGNAVSANDVADEWFEDESRQQRRRERQVDTESSPTPPLGMRLVRRINIKPEEEDGNDDQRIGDEDGTAVQRFWNWYVLPRSADDDGSKSARERQDLYPHLREAERHAERIVLALRLPQLEARAVTLAAKWHDLGKHRAVWQRSIGNQDYFKDPPTVLAKSGGRMRPIELNSYRHEFGSLLDVLNVQKTPEFAALTEDVQDLVLHLIAAHHGRARPHFPLEEVFDPENPESAAAQVARESPRRFARLQRRYGRWGLAYLESLVRAADILASGGGQ